MDESVPVPEDKIGQCQAVLAGKSREVITRELRKTNLDVNMAINNILSRDEGEEPPSAAPMLHPFHNSDDLFRLIGEEEPGKGLIVEENLQSDHFRHRKKWLAQSLGRPKKVTLV